MCAASKFFKTKDGLPVLAFLVIMSAFVLIMAGIVISRMWMCKVALILLVGSLLYIPLWNRLFAKRKNEKTD